MTIYRVIRLFILFGLALFTGFSSGAKHEIVKAAAYDFPFTDQPENQNNYLIISVADHGNVKNALKGIWLVATYVDSDRVDFLPIFPSVTRNHAQFNTTLANSFKLSADNKPGNDFWDQMKAVNTWWNGYIILDENDTNQFLDIVVTNNAAISSNNVPNFADIPWWNENPHTSLYQLSELFDFGCKSVNSTAKQQTQLPLWFGFYLNIETDISPQMLLTMWSRLATKHGSLRCEFPLRAQAALE